MTYARALVTVVLVGSACATAGDDEIGGSVDARVQRGDASLGSGSDAPASLADARPSVDAPRPADAAITSSCSVAASWGAMGPVDGDAFDDVTRKGFYGGLESAAISDELVIDLFDGYGAFATGYRTGTFTITGAETDWWTCGVCLRIVADVDQTTMYWDNTAEMYLAQSGSITITSHSGRLTGSLSNVVFRHVVIDDLAETTTPHPDGCTSNVMSATFDELMF